MTHLKEEIATLQCSLDRALLLQRSLKKKVINRASHLRLLHKELDTVFEISNSIISFPNLEEVLQLTTRLVASVMALKACTIRLLDPQKRILLPGASFGFPSDYLEKTPLHLGEGVSGLAAKLQKEVIVENVLRDPRVLYPQQLVQQGFRAVMVAPILFYEEVLGTMAVYSEHPRPFALNERLLLSTFAAQAALAIKNTQLHEQGRLNYLDTINAFVLTMEARHSYTRGHAERVTRYALELGRELHLREEELGMIRWLGKLHDVGKIAVPDRILDKPGKLTVAERAQIELHPSRGAEMLEPLKFLHKGLAIVKNHHERYDGTGYPDGLTGEGIPLLARIIAIADAFDAMTTDRSYRKAMGISEAITELRKQRGTQFDPHLCDLFLASIEREAA